MEVRRARKADISQSAEIFRQNMAQKPYLLNVARAKAAEIIRNYFSTQVMYVAVADGKVAGFVIGDKYMAEEGRYLWISEIFVSVDMQGKGVGTKLMEAIENHYKGKIAFTELLVHKHSPAADFYRKLDFKETDYIKLSRKSRR